jgi:cystathionine gamma-synthase
MAEHERNAARLARQLAAHSAVAAVHYPGLRTHPDHELVRRQQRGFGGMVSFELADLDAVRRFVDGLEHFTLAESLGGVESLVAHPATMTHVSMSAAARAAAGIGDGLVRLSVGIEHGDDLARDVARGLARVAAGASMRAE